MDCLLGANANTVTLLASLVSVIIGIFVAFIFHRLTRPGRNKKAYKLLKGFSKHLGEPLGEYYFTNSREANYEVAKYIYENADEEIIATSFNEDPSRYGKEDLATRIKDKTRFTRISNREICSAASERKVEKLMSQFMRGSSFVIIPRGLSYTRVDGIFCKFGDDSYLTFFAYRHPDNPQKNRGVIFRNGIAKSFFEYYDALTKRYAS